MTCNEHMSLSMVLEILKDSLEEFNELKKGAQIMSYQGNVKDQRRKLEKRANLIISLPKRVGVVLNEKQNESMYILNKVNEMASQGQEALDFDKEFKLKTLIEPKIGQNLLEKLILEINELLENKTGE